MSNYLSKLRLCNLETFNRAVSPFKKNEIAYPQWFVENIKKGEGVFTTGVYDCVSPTFARPQINGTQQHICPNDENLSKLDLGNNLLLKKMVDGKEYINALLVGGKDQNRSKKVIDSLKGFCEDNSIPYSSLLKHKNTQDPWGTNIGYIAPKNEYLLSNNDISAFLEKNKRRFLQMPKEEIRAELEKFLNGHYQDVDVSKLDLTA